MQAAVLHRQYQVARHLVSRGAPVDGTGVIQSPLWFAVAHGDAEMAALLLNLGSDANWQTDEMGTPLHAALNSFSARDNRLALKKFGVKTRGLKSMRLYRCSKQNNCERANRNLRLKYSTRLTLPYFRRVPISGVF